MFFWIKQDWKLQSSCNIVYTNNSLIKIVLCRIARTWDEYIRRDKQIHGYRKTMGLLSVYSTKEPFPFQYNVNYLAGGWVVTFPEKQFNS